MVIYAFVFLFLFIIGGVIGLLTLSGIPYSFWISGFLIAVFGTGAGTLIISLVSRH